MKKRVAICLVACAVTAPSAPSANACTRILHETGSNSFIVGRTMDWYDDTGTDLRAFPRGMARDGGIGNGSIQWTSRYGSVVGDIYDVGSADGMNEAGLVATILYLVEADYGDARASGEPLLSIGAWAQYILDNCGTVAEAVAALKHEPFAIIAPNLPGGKAAGAHVAIADASGERAILEYIKGKLVIHHDRRYVVMTNPPPFDEQLAINTYWNDVGGLKFLPGTHRASDRFARVSWNLNATQKVKDAKLAVATVFSVIRNISVPLGISDPEKPSIAATLWRSVADIEARRYDSESALSPSVFWVDIAKLKLAPGSKPSKLNLSDSPIPAGEVSDKFVAAEPFKFLAH